MGNKKKSLRDQAYGWAEKQDFPNWLEAYVAGHRANKLTRAERAVVKAVAAYVAELHRYGCASTGKILDAYDAYDRAKGGAK